MKRMNLKFLNWHWRYVAKFSKLHSVIERYPSTFMVRPSTEKRLSSNIYDPILFYQCVYPYIFSLLFYFAHGSSFLGCRNWWLVSSDVYTYAMQDMHDEAAVLEFDNRIGSTLLVSELFPFHIYLCLMSSQCDHIWPTQMASKRRLW